MSLGSASWNPAPFAFGQIEDYASLVAKGDHMQNEWMKPREYTFVNAVGKVFHEIAYSRQDVNVFAKMHKAVRYKPTEDSSTCKPMVAD